MHIFKSECSLRHIASFRLQSMISTSFGIPSGRYHDPCVTWAHMKEARKVPKIYHKYDSLGRFSSHSYIFIKSTSSEFVILIILLWFNCYSRASIFVDLVKVIVSRIRHFVDNGSFNTICYKIFYINDNIILSIISTTKSTKIGNQQILMLIKQLYRQLPYNFGRRLYTLRVKGRPPDGWDLGTCPCLTDGLCFVKNDTYQN